MISIQHRITRFRELMSQSAFNDEDTFLAFLSINVNNSFDQTNLS